MGEERHRQGMRRGKDKEEWESVRFKRWGESGGCEAKGEAC